jgi:hypothetical protein
MYKILLTAILLASTLCAKYTENVKLPSITFSMAKDENFKAMQRNCQWCHSYGYIINQGKQSREFWNKSVVKMREVYKAPISAKDEITITNYLFEHYGNGKIK